MAYINLCCSIMWPNYVMTFPECEQDFTVPVIMIVVIFTVNINILFSLNLFCYIPPIFKKKSF